MQTLFFLCFHLFFARFSQENYFLNALFVPFIFFLFAFFSLLYLGEAISKNPGYLKLRKIRAAQSIAKTVSSFSLLFLLFHFLICKFFLFTTKNRWPPPRTRCTWMLSRWCWTLLIKISISKESKNERWELLFFFKHTWK